MRGIVFLVFLVLASQQALADVQDYCAAVARDFADLRPVDRAVWQQRYDDSSADCVEQFSSAPQVADPKPKAKTKVKLAKPGKPEATVAAATPVAKTRKKPAKVATATTSVEGAIAEPTATAAPTKPKLAPGSAEWLDYCSRKYSSFNKEKGTYTSKKGVERKCLVTADFK